MVYPVLAGTGTRIAVVLLVQSGPLILDLTVEIYRGYEEGLSAFITVPKRTYGVTRTA